MVRSPSKTGQEAITAVIPNKTDITLANHAIVYLVLSPEGMFLNPPLWLWHSELDQSHYNGQSLAYSFDTTSPVMVEDNLRTKAANASKAGGDLLYLRYRMNTTKNLAMFSVFAWINLAELDLVQPLVSMESRNMDGFWFKVSSSGQLLLELVMDDLTSVVRTTEANLTLNMWHWVGATFHGLSGRLVMPPEQQD